jgi:hypothetical protein
MVKTIEKKMIYEFHDFDTLYNFVTLETVNDFVATFEGVKPSDVVLKVHNNYDDHYNLTIKFERLETDEEFSKRLKKVEKNRLRRELNKLTKEEKEQAKKKQEEEAYKLFLSLKNRFEGEKNVTNNLG